MKRKIGIIALIGAVALGTLALGGCNEKELPGERFVMRAEINEVMRGELLVEVIEAPHGNSGPFFVLLSDKTDILDKEGNKITVESLGAGQVIDITYGGQVMMSYPPKISAIKVQIAL